MGVNGPLHLGGSLRCVAHPTSPKTVSVKVHPDKRPSAIRGWRHLRGGRMGNSSGGYLWAVGDLRLVRYTRQLRRMRSGLILRQTAFTARPL
jgi:hypothetical protein